MSENNELEKAKEDGSIDLQEAFRIGLLVDYLRNAGAHEFPFTKPDENSNNILEGLEELTVILKNSNLESTVLSDIEHTKNRLIESHLPDEEEIKQTIYLNDYEYDNLNKTSATWNNVIREELSSMNNIIVENRGLIDVKQAMNNPKEPFHDESVWDDLPPQTQSDLTEACQTLAFECPTSTVFLSLRAVEDRLHEWYKQETGRDIEDRTFGQVLSELDDQYSEDDRPPILSHLDFLKERRNQVAHPERSPDEQEAEDTLIMVRGTITNIQDQIP
jgi:hypothetical protein